VTANPVCCNRHYLLFRCGDTSIYSTHNLRDIMTHTLYILEIYGTHSFSKVYWYYDLAKWLSYYLYFFSFSFLFFWTYYTRKECRNVSHVTGSHHIISHNEYGKVVYRLYSSCISSIQNLMETPLSSSLLSIGSECS